MKHTPLQQENKELVTVAWLTRLLVYLEQTQIGSAEAMVRKKLEQKLNPLKKRNEAE